MGELQLPTEFRITILMDESKLKFKRPIAVNEPIHVKIRGEPVATIDTIEVHNGKLTIDFIIRDHDVAELLLGDFEFFGDCIDDRE